MTAISQHCHDCNRPLRSFTQQGLTGGKPAYELIECINPECDLYKVTLSPQQMGAMTEETRAEYRTVSRRIRERV